MSMLSVYDSRGKSWDITIEDPDGETITPGDSDFVRATIKRQGQTAVLTVTSGTPTANGSLITKGAANRLRLDASDLTFEPGAYSLIVDYFDAADSSEWKLVEKQILYLEGL